MSLVAGRVCAVTEKLGRWVVTGCDAFTRVQFTGSKGRPIEVVTAGAAARHAPAPAVLSAVEGDEELSRKQLSGHGLGRCFMCGW
jgi:hypothetical protein